MPDVSLNGIEFEIKGSSDAASDSIDKLTEKLNGLRTSLLGVKAVSKLATSIKNVGSAAKKATGKLGAFLASIKRIAMYRAIRAIIKSITEALQEGAQGFYDFTKETGAKFTNYSAALDRVKGSTSLLKAQLGAAWGSLFTAIAPIIEKLIDMATRLANVLTMIFAKLSGANGWYKATKGINDTTKSIKGAGKAAKEAMKYLAPFDELNRLPDNNQSGGGGGGGDSGDKPEYKWFNFEDFDIGEAIAQIIAKIRDAFNKVSDWFAGIDWKSVGKKFYQNLKKTLAKIDFKGLSKAFWRMLGSALGAVSGFVAGFVGEAWEDVKKYFLRFIDADGDGKWCGTDIFLGILKGIWNAIKSGARAIKDYILIPFINGFKAAFGISSPAREMVEPGRMVGLGILEGIAKPFKDAYAWVKENIMAPLVKAIEQLNDVLPDLTDFKKVWDGIKTKTVTLTAKLAGTSTSTFSTLKEKWDAIKTKTSTLTANIKKDFTDKVLNGLKSAWETLKSKTATFTAKLSADSTVKSFVNSWNSLKDKTLQLKASIVDSVKSAWNSAAKAWNNSSILSALGKLPLLAKGGVVDSATFIGNAIVGEAGKEAIVPLEHNTEWIDTVASGMLEKLGGSSNVVDYNKLTNAVYAGMSRALAENPDDRDIYLDGEVVYKKMVQRNKRETFVRGMNPMMA